MNKLLRYRHRVLIQRSILPFAWPIFVELTCVVMMGIISTILVSHLGSAETAAVGICDNITFIIISLLTAIALGGSVYIAQSLGKRRIAEAKDYATQAMLLSVVISLIFSGLLLLFSRPILTAIAYGAEKSVIDNAELYLSLITLSYPLLAICLAAGGILRALGNSRHPAWCNILMNILNILFSYPLIYGIPGSDWQGFGIIGSGIGIIAARGVGSILMLMSLSRGILPIVWKDFLQPFKLIILKDILALGIPASVESLMFNIGKLITQAMVAGMGTVAMAGNVITFSAVLFINIPGNALAMASTVLVGKRLGQGRHKLALLELKLILLLSSLLLSVMGLISMPSAALIARAYTQDPDVQHVVVNLLYLNAIMMPIWAASFVLPAAFKGAKDVKYSMWTAISSMWGCRIVFGYLLGIYFGLGVYGVWIGMFSDWWVRGGLYLYRLFNQRWLRMPAPATNNKLTPST